MDNLRKNVLENCKNLITQKIFQNNRETIQDKKIDTQETQEIIAEEKYNEQTVEEENKQKKDTPNGKVGSLLAEKDLDFLKQIVKSTIQSQDKQLSNFPTLTEQKSKLKDTNKNNPIILDDDEPLPLSDKPEITVSPDLGDPTLIPSKTNASEIQTIPSDESDGSTMTRIDVLEIIKRLKLDEPGELKLWTVEENIQIIEKSNDRIKKLNVPPKIEKNEKVFFKVKKSINPINSQKPLTSQKGEKTTKKSYAPMMAEHDLSQYMRKQETYVEEQSDQMLKANKFAKKGSKDDKIKESKIKSNFGNLILKKTSEQALQSSNLAIKSTKYLVDECHEKNLINRELYDWFNLNFTTEKVMRFIQKFEEKTIQVTTFGETKISIIDHRRMAELLVKFHPQEYKILPIIEPKTRIEVFLKNLYELDSANYKSLCQTIDAESKVIWWKQVQQNYFKNQFKNGFEKEKKSQMKPLQSNKPLIKKQISPSSQASKKRGPYKVKNRNYEIPSSSLSSEGEDEEEVKNPPKKKMIK